MSQSSAVYQPTTQTYGNNDHEHWHDKPIGYLTTSITNVIRRPCGLSCTSSRSIFSIILIISCITCFTLGLVMLTHGSVGYANNPESEQTVYLIITIFGAILFALGILLFVFIMRLTRRACWRNAKSQSVAGAEALTVNPSTDFLVSAQYAPVSEVTYRPEDSEQSKLMTKENRELINEDTDRMMENDPRIVLRPLNPPQQEET